MTGSAGGSATTASRGHRRSAGIGLLLAIVVAVLALPGIGGRRIAGTATAVDLPASPHVGDCLLMPRAAGDGGGDRSGSPLMTTRFGPCDQGTTLGQVVDVHHGPRGAADPLSQIACHAAAARYAGLVVSTDGYVPRTHPVADGGPGTAEPIRWSYPFQPDTRWVAQAPALPTEVSEWFACVASPPTTWQQGSLAGAFTGGRLPGGYGRCWVAPTPQPGNAMVACLWPHNAELMGIAATDADAADAELQESCRGLAADRLGRADPTAGGALRARVGEGDPTDPTAAGRVFCYLSMTGGTLVNGSVIGLKTDPISYQR